VVFYLAIWNDDVILIMNHSTLASDSLCCGSIASGTIVAALGTTMI